MTPLQTELARPEYAGLSDAEAAARINAAMIVSRRLVTASEIAQRIWAIGGAETRGRLLAAMAADNAQIATIARVAYDLLQGPGGIEVDMDRPDFKQAIGALQQAGVLTAEIVETLDWLANVTATRAKLARIPSPVLPAQITLARAK